MIFFLQWSPVNVLAARRNRAWARSGSSNANGDFIVTLNTISLLPHASSYACPHPRHLLPQHLCIRFNTVGSELTKKRKSGGRSKGGKGSSDHVQCSNCGTIVPKDKAKRVTSRISLVEPSLARELRAAGTYIATQNTLKLYCVSCAVHFGHVKVRAKNERRRKY